MTEDKENQEFKFLKGKESAYPNDDWQEWVKHVRKDISEALNAKNVAFLLGSGCSSLKRDGKEIGIATMLPLAEEFCNAAGKTVDGEGDEDRKSWCLTVEEKRYLCDDLKVCLEDDTYKKNLERLMEVLFAQRFVLKARQENLIVIDGIIEKVKNFFWIRITQGEFKTDPSITDLYEKFYRKLVLRDRSLSRPGYLPPIMIILTNRQWIVLEFHMPMVFLELWIVVLIRPLFVMRWLSNLMLPTVNGLLSMLLFISVKYMVQSPGWRMITDFFRLRRFFHQMRQIEKGY